MNVELLYLPDCPNVGAAREQLRAAMVEAGLAPRWTEHDVTSAGAPERMRGYGSPTILVDGEDVSGAASAQAAACRVYLGSEVRGAPARAVIVRALVRGALPDAREVPAGLAGDRDGPSIRAATAPDEPAVAPGRHGCCDAG